MTLLVVYNPKNTEITAGARAREYTANPENSGDLLWLPAKDRRDKLS